MMFIARVVLGHAYISRQPQRFRKPPCLSCNSDGCVNQNHHSSDSVIGTHRDSGVTRLNFREFIVYDLKQSYPEFLVEYERK